MQTESLSTPSISLGTPKPDYEVADVFRLYGQDYRRTYPLTHEQWEVMWDIEHCRTAALGGHVDECDRCGVLRISYNSCRNRHCPKCQALAKARWIEARRAELLPIEYFHGVFTTDHAINVLVGWNRALIYTLIFAAVAESLKAFGLAYLGGEIGVVVVLHTWGQGLEQHIHVHCIITGGALSPDGQHWQACPKGFLFPVELLSATFRDRLCEGLRRAYGEGKLSFGGQCAELADAARFEAWLGAMQAKNWEVYLKEPFGGPEGVLDYLGGYVQRVAISNRRIVGIENGQVSFTWRDNRNGGILKVMTLTADEFIRRFLLHVLPKGFVRIRYFGLLSSHGRAAKLQRCRELLGADAPPPPAKESYDRLLERLTGVDVKQCPVCGVGRMIHKQTLGPGWDEAELERMGKRIAVGQVVA